MNRLSQSLYVQRFKLTNYDWNSIYIKTQDQKIRTKTYIRNEILKQRTQLYKNASIINMMRNYVYDPINYKICIYLVEGL